MGAWLAPVSRVLTHTSASLQRLDREAGIIPPDNSLKQLILRHYHDAPTAGHPGRDRTEERVTKTFWWPQMTPWITEYVKGCTTCQQNKKSIHPNRTLPYRITTG